MKSSNLECWSVYLCYGLMYIFFGLQDLIDRINSYFQRIAFQSNFLLIASNTLRDKLFPVKLSSLHWNGAA